MPFPRMFLAPELGAQCSEPAQPLLVRNSRVRRRGRGQDEEARGAQTAFLQAVLGPLPEHAFVRRLADERDDLGPELLGQALEPLGRPCEVAAPQVAASFGRAVGGVREPEAKLEHLPLLLRYEKPGREVRVGEEPPEVVAGVREMRRSGGRAEPWVDPAEDDAQAGSQDVRDQGRKKMAQAETAVRTIKNYIGGGWVDAEASESVDVTNPANGETLAQVPMSSQADLDRAVQAARHAFPEWRATSPVERARACFRLKNVLEERR